ALHARTYNRIRCRLNMLHAQDNLMVHFRLLSKADVRSSTAILDFNKPGSSSGIHLSWIWHCPQSRFGPNMNDPALELTDPSTMLECEYLKRVHWLRARASFHRWREEELLLDNEMQWTVRFFENKSIEWGSVKDAANVSPGGQAYAARQETQYSFLASRAQAIF
ncbi:hypothetical protein CPC08DRAFT_597900, partial [Agrocybe pediades]